MQIIARATWGARFGRGSPDPGAEGRVVIHHSQRPHLEAGATYGAEVQAIRGIEEFHVKTNGWDGIGYNFLVAPSGRVYEGRGWANKGAHAGPGVNGTSIGICLLIDGERTSPSDRMIQAVRALITRGIRNGEISERYVLSGHRDHMGTTCPGGKVYARLQDLRHDAVTVRPAERAIPRVVPRVVVEAEQRPAAPAIVEEVEVPVTDIRTRFDGDASEVPSLPSGGPQIPAGVREAAGRVIRERVIPAVERFVWGKLFGRK